MRPRNYSTIPEVVSGYALDERWSVIVPIARTNLVVNPSFETNTTSWTAIGGSIARSTAQQYHGAYSLAITPTATTTDGVRYDTVSLASGTTYAYSAKVLGIAGKSYKLSIETTGGAELASITFVATGRWQWVYGYYTETSSTTRRFTLRKAGGAETSVFYLDGAQVEAIGAGESVSTYIDGDQQGNVPNQQPPAYLWTGTPHASTSSRSGLTRAGGMVVPFSKYNFLLTAIVGLGLAIPQNVKTEYARLDGAFDDYTRKPTRQFTLTGTFESRGGYLSLRQQRGGLAQLLDRDRVGLDQRLVLLREVTNDCGDVDSTTCRVFGKYAGGLDGNTDNHYAETAAIAFEQYLPAVASDGEQGASLTVQQSVTNVNEIIQRSAGGLWQALGTGGSGGGVFSLTYGPDGTLYAAGDFTSMGGVANTLRIAKWNGSAWSAMGTGLNGSGFAFAFDAAGNLYVGGNFTAAGGVANTAYIAKWNGSAWSALGTGMNNRVLGLAFDTSGNLYATGFFTTAGGGGANRIAKWDGSAWSALGTGLNADGYSVVRGPDGSMYVGGDFTTANGTSATRVAKFSGTTFTALSSGMNGIVKKLGFTANGKLYAVGNFTTAGGITSNAVAAWNGTAWAPLGTGLTGGTTVESLTITPDNSVYVGGDFTTAGGLGVPDGVARWNGATWLPIDANLPGSGTIVYALAAANSGEITIGYDSGGTSSATTSALTTLTNNGTAKTYPTIELFGPSSGSALGQAYQIVNYTTKRSIFLNLTLSIGETATLVFQPDNLSFISTFQGNIANKILPGSNESDFFLQPGANSIAVFIDLNGNASAASFWRPQFALLDDVP